MRVSGGEEISTATTLLPTQAVLRPVLDTNVLVSGLLSAAGPPGWIVEAVLAGELELAFDMAIRHEY